MGFVSKTYPLIASLRVRRTGRAIEVGPWLCWNSVDADPWACRTHNERRTALLALAGNKAELDIAIEVGKTMLILMLVALGIVALRCVLILAYGVLH